MAIKIRPITLKDAEGFRQCIGAIANEGRYFVETEAPSLPEALALVRRSLKKKNPFFVATDSKRVVGYAIVNSFDMPSLRHNGNLGMGLLPAYREMGLGTKLLSAVLKMSRGKFDFINLDVLGKNRRARRLYEKMDFKLCGRIKRAVKLAHGYDDSLVMRKKMKP